MKVILHIVFSICLVGSLIGQSVVMDDAQYIEDLWLLRSLSDSSKYYYLPNQIIVEKNEDGLPKFSMLKYSTLDKEQEGYNPITQSQGGSILNFILKLVSDPKTVTKAESALKRKIGNHAFIEGPMIYKQGNYTLISNTLKSSAPENTAILAQGRAPVLIGNSIPFSASLDELKSNLLLESFQMAASDISILFDLEFEVFSSEFSGSIIADWSKLQSYRKKKGGVDMLIFSTKMEKEIQSLVKENCIEIKSFNLDQNQEEFLQSAYLKIADFIFKPVPNITPKNAKSKKGLINGLTDLAGALNPFGVSANYTMREFSEVGTSEFNLSGRNLESRHNLTTINIKHLYNDYKEDENIFKVIDISETDNSQRMVLIGVDAVLKNHFDKMVENVTVALRKKHTDGSLTMEYAAINDSTLNKYNKIFYPNRKDTDIELWKEYEYKSSWQFTGGAKYESDWNTQADAMISLNVPYELKKIYLQGNLEEKWESGVQGIHVNVTYDFFGQSKSTDVMIRPQEENRIDFFEIIIPNDYSHFEYEITYIYTNEKKSKQITDEFGIILLN